MLLLVVPETLDPAVLEILVILLVDLVDLVIRLLALEGLVILLEDL